MEPSCGARVTPSRAGTLCICSHLLMYILQHAAAYLTSPLLYS